jgi:hypothetical protein
MRILTFDIGGANIKRLLYDSRSKDVTSDIFYFPIWKRKDELTEFLRRKSIIADVIGITMTAELSDVFPDKASGVMHIVDACENSLSNPMYLSVDGRVIRKDEMDDPLPLAASNWVASRYHLEKNYHEGILVDVGSTTTDIIPFGPGTNPEKTDLDRLRGGQLVYTGFLRTPISAVVNKVPYKGALTRISSEYFAITADIYNVLGLLEKYSCSTPDGGGKSKRDSMRRVARHLCADLDDVGEEGIIGICEHVYQEQAMDIAEALGDVMKDSGMGDAYVCGIGSALGKRACEIARLTTHDLSALTPAHANLPCLGLAEILRDRGKV